MTRNRDFILSSELASVAGISGQRLRLICQEFSKGVRSEWNGAQVDVRTLHGRGGKSGLQYVVKIASLPADLQERLKALQAAGEPVPSLRFGDAAQLERNWKYDVIKAALEHPKGTADRAAEIDRLHGTERLDWTGRYMRLKSSTVRSWIQTYELEGIHGLASRVRNDKGVKRVFISRAWMKAVPFDEDIKSAIHSDLKQYVRSLIKGGAQFKQTRVLASEKLKEITGAYGFRPNDPAMEEQAFSIPQEFVQDELHYQAVYRHKTDRKASEDNKPRIRRTIEGLAPMEVVVMDVHHINVLIKRENGTTATAKLLAFHDIATNRVFCEIVFFEVGGGVRNTDIITAFVHMCQHPAFGVPHFLYADNGSEYRFADYLEDALKLGSKVVAFNGREERNRIIRAKPYNASAKHVEGWFRQMNQQYFRHIPGWIDDDRMNPKRPTLGKLPAPFDQGFDTFCATVYGYLTAYEHMPQQGALKGKSPAMAFNHHIRNGWKATVMDDYQLLTVFTKPETRVVEKHGISVKGTPWTCDGLLEYFGSKVVVHIPQFHNFSALLITDEHGNEIGEAVSDTEFSVLDERGARESARRTSIRNKGLTKLGKSVPDIDVGAELLAYGQKHLPVVPNEPDGVISVNRSGSRPRAIIPTSSHGKSRQQEEEEQRIIDEARSALVNAAANMRSN